MRPLAPDVERAREGDDPRTIEACRKGDRTALERVFRAEAPYLERVLRRIVGPSADVEDLLQNTLMAAMAAFPRFRGEASVRTWMTRIAVRIAMAHLKARPKPRVELELVSNAAPSHELEMRRRFERLHHHLGELGAKKRVAFILHVFDERPIAEVAALMGATVTATKSRIFWARRELLKRAEADPILRELVEEAR